MTNILLLVSQHSLAVVMAAAFICTLMAALVVGLVERTKEVARFV
jgi:hypothetical protein